MRVHTSRILRAACGVLLVAAGLHHPATAEEMTGGAPYRQVALFEVPSSLHLSDWEVAKAPRPPASESQLLYFSAGGDLLSGTFNDDDLRVGLLASLAPNKKSGKDSFVAQLRKKKGVTKTTVHGAPAAAMIAPTQVVIWWVENNHQVSIVQMGRGTSLATTRALAQTVRIDTNATQPVRMKTPATTTIRINQTLTSINSPTASATYQSANGQQMIGVSTSKTPVAAYEAALTVVLVIVSTLSGGIQTQQLRLAPTAVSVNGQPGFHTDALDDDNAKHLIWFSPTGESFELAVRNDSPLSLTEAAERVASVDANRWDEIRAESEVQQGDAPAPMGELAAAGTTGVLPWTGQRIALANKVCVRVSVATTVNRFCASGGTTTRWTSVRTNNGFAAVGMTRPDVRTVVVRDAQGIEIARSETSQIAPSLASFVVPTPATLLGATIVGLDSTGTPVEGPVGVGA